MLDISFDRLQQRMANFELVKECGSDIDTIDGEITTEGGAGYDKGIHLGGVSKWDLCRNFQNIPEKSRVLRSFWQILIFPNSLILQRLEAMRPRLMCASPTLQGPESASLGYSHEGRLS